MRDFLFVVGLVAVAAASALMDFSSAEARTPEADAVIGFAIYKHRPLGRPAPTPEPAPPHNPPSPADHADPPPQPPANAAVRRASETPPPAGGSANPGSRAVTGGACISGSCETGSVSWGTSRAAGRPRILGRFFGRRR